MDMDGWISQLCLGIASLRFTSLRLLHLLTLGALRWECEVDVKLDVNNEANINPSLSECTRYIHTYHKQGGRR